MLDEVGNRRRLGVMVSSVTITEGRDLSIIPPDHPDLSDGWWTTESNGRSLWRWTNGSASLRMVKGQSRIDIVLNPLPNGYYAKTGMEPAEMEATAAAA